ncbi:MAG: hypothetical protein KC776_35355 [Myxococcales bacterium]|nr:hypothetical protein [Myxococcales bacterium]MCB9578653.1 hypothetical protein [Polyangiaceae bacterium]
MPTFRSFFALALLSSVVFASCADPGGAYDDFVTRCEESDNCKVQVVEDSGTGDAGPCVVPAAGELDGDYVFSLSASVKPEAPLLFATKVTTADGADGLEMNWTLTPLDAKDRSTEIPPSIELPTMKIGADGSFDVNPDPLDVTGQANPISGSNITADISSLRGTVCNLDGFYCGLLDAAVTKPIPLDLKNSNWTLTKLTSPGVYPEPTINCAKKPAGPPPT